MAPPVLDAKARAAAYARTKRISCTYVLMPVYNKRFFEMLAPEVEEKEEGGDGSAAGGWRMVMHLPSFDEGVGDGNCSGQGNKRNGGDGNGVREEPKIMCMSVDELGPAVANIFESYQVYAGREIGLMTDFVTVSKPMREWMEQNWDNVGLR